MQTKKASAANSVKTKSMKLPAKKATTRRGEGSDYKRRSFPKYLFVCFRGSSINFLFFVLFFVFWCG